MSTDIAERLRTLAHEHQEGRLDLTAYRALRGPLLDSLASGVTPTAMETTQPRVAHRQMQRDAITRPGKPHQTKASDSVAEPLATSRRLHQIAGWIAATIVVVIAVVVWAWFQHDRSEPQQSTNTTSAPPGAARSALDQFMDAGDWGDGRIAALNATLMELGSEQIAPLTREAGFQRFVDELRRRLKEQQALAPVTLTVDNSPLAALAVTVGVDLKSPDSELHIVAAPPAQRAEGIAEGKGSTGAAPVPRAGAGRTRDGGANAVGAVAAGEAQQPSSTPQPQASAAVDAQSAEGAPVAVGGSATGSRSAADAASTADGGARSAGRSAGPAAKTAADQSTPDACPRERLRSRRPLCQDTLASGADGPLLALVPAGAFDMGSTQAPEEQPVHHVTIGDAFAISVYEVSQGEFKQYCEATRRPCTTQPWSGDDYPVVNVSWDEARGYVEWLSTVTHHHYTLPTESQWEYAARAGSTGLYPSGTSLSPTDANFSMLKKQTVAARRSQKFNANAFRLVHTVGNVREWVEDPWSQTYASAPSDGAAMKSTKPTMRVARGGSYTDGSTRLRLSMREGLAPGTRDVTTGFRIVRELQ